MEAVTLLRNVGKHLLDFTTSRPRVHVVGTSNKLYASRLSQNWDSNPTVL